MLFRSISILLLLSLTAFGQAFTPRRPFVYQLLSTVTTNPSPINIPINYWWVSSDLDTNTVGVTNWPDRIWTNQWKQEGAAGIQPRWTTNGIVFNRDAGTYLTGLVTFAVNTNASSHYLLIERTTNTYNGDVLTLGDTSFELGYWLDATDNRFFTHFVSTYLYPCQTPLNAWQDIVMTFDATNLTIKCYTNGVPIFTNTSGTPGYFTFDKVGGKKSIQSAFTGVIREIGIWSNLVLNASSVSNLHYYATNTYKYTP